MNDIKTAIYLAGTLLFLTPVLKSLTVAYSEDTIILLVSSNKNILLINTFEHSLRNYSSIPIRLHHDKKTFGI